MRKNILPTPMVVKIFLPSSTSDYILTRIVRLITEASQAYLVIEALSCPLAHFMNRLPCHGRNLPPGSLPIFPIRDKLWCIITVSTPMPTGAKCVSLPESLFGCFLLIQGRSLF